MKIQLDKGFTLIEIMIVIAIIGILAAIAIPQFSAYRIKSYNSIAVSDLRNAAAAQEAYFIEHKSYANSIEELAKKPDFYTSPGVVMNVGGDQTGYTMRAYHPKGNKSYMLTGPGGSVTGN
ncbi:MAG: prepilin-type N-terminal cleavage/methylation domain-containing protein [Deltaproteobacteria bacterium]|nr:prepilin-type N-terminal cleavage/methylation domain-containing protein [Deltaproteobacteria bacterium]